MQRRRKIEKDSKLTFLDTSIYKHQNKTHTHTDTEELKHQITPSSDIPKWAHQDPDEKIGTYCRQ